MSILTGAPGSGKTTVLEKTVKALKDRGISVGGVVSQEVREGGIRVGFEILDLATGKHGWLAHVDQKCGPRAADTTSIWTTWKTSAPKP